MIFKPLKNADMGQAKRAAAFENQSDLWTIEWGTVHWRTVRWRRLTKATGRQNQQPYEAHLGQGVPVTALMKDSLGWSGDAGHESPRPGLRAVTQHSLAELATGSEQP